MKLPAAATADEEFNRRWQSEIWAQAAREVCRRHKIAFAEIKRAPSGGDVVLH